MKTLFAAMALAFAPALAAAAQPQDISRPGTVPHAAARTGFPEQVGELRRISAVRYGETDISASYELSRGEDVVRISVYVYPAPPARQSQRTAACREHMTSVVDVIVRQYPGADEVENGPAEPVPGVGEGLGYRSVHNIRFPLRGGRFEPARSETRVYCYVDGDWLVKYRISSTPGFEVGALVETLVREGPWPGRGPGSIAMR